MLSVSLIRDWIAAAFSDRGFCWFAEGKFQAAAYAFEVVCWLNPEGDRMEIILSCLGRCYLALGKGDKALGNLSKAYYLFHNPKDPYGEPGDRAYPEEYKQMLKAYSQVLLSLGRTELAEKIAMQSRILLSGRNRVKY